MSAKPVGFRRCPATVMPQHLGDEPGRLRCADSKSSGEGLLVGGGPVPALELPFILHLTRRMNMTDWISRHRHRLAATCAGALCTVAATIPLVGALTTTAAASSCPKRIVSISPTATESLFAIGAGRQVVAV